MSRPAGSGVPREAAWQRLWRRPIVRRIVAGTGSNAYAQAVTIAIQLLSLPLFLSQWNLATYGHWLVLSALPAALAMADAGMVSAAGNRMTMRVAQGDWRGANQTLQSALIFVLGAGLLAVVLLLLLVMLLAFGMPLLVPLGVPDSWAAWASWSHVGAGTAGQGPAALLLLALAVVAALLGGLPEAVYKSTHRYALGAALATTTRLLEWLGGLIGLWWRGDFIAVATGMLAARVLCSAAMAWHATRGTPALRWGFADARLAEIKAAAAPAIAFMAFPAANALNFQGMTLIAAARLGPAATVVFNSYRTLARVTVQATATFSLSLWPEFSRLFGERRLPTLASLYRRSRLLSVLLAAAASAAVYAAAPWLLEFWSNGQIGFSAPLMAVAMAYAAAAGGWHVARVLLLSTNEHSSLAWPYLAASALLLPVAWLMAQAFGMIGILLAMLLLEVAMLVFCSALCRRLLRGPLPQVAASNAVAEKLAA